MEIVSKPGKRRAGYARVQPPEFSNDETIEANPNISKYGNFDKNLEIFELKYLLCYPHKVYPYFFMFCETR